MCIYVCVHVFWSMCVFMFVCVNMQMKQKGSQHLSGWDDGGVLALHRQIHPLLFFWHCCSRQCPFGAFGGGAKCVSGLCSKVIW